MDPTAAAPLPNLVCPLCGGPNDCVPAGCGRFDVDCWCSQARIPAAVLDRVPVEQRGLACICRRCAGDERDAG
jgi:hypothetical protein